MIQIYTTPSCASCRKAKKWFDQYNIPYSEKNIFSIKLSKDDIDCLNMLKETGKEVIVIGTKCDKLNQSMKSKFIKNVAKNIDAKVYLTSVMKKETVSELTDYIDKKGRQ